MLNDKIQLFQSTPLIKTIAAQQYAACWWPRITQVRVVQLAAWG
jgi:hypothetical protein